MAPNNRILMEGISRILTIALLGLAVASRYFNGYNSKSLSVTLFGLVVLHLYGSRYNGYNYQRSKFMDVLSIPTNLYVEVIICYIAIYLSYVYSNYNNAFLYLGGLYTWFSIPAIKETIFQPKIIVDNWTYNYPTSK